MAKDKYETLMSLYETVNGANHMLGYYMNKLGNNPSNFSLVRESMSFVKAKRAEIGEKLADLEEVNVDEISVQEFKNLINNTIQNTKTFLVILDEKIPVIESLYNSLASMRK